MILTISIFILGVFLGYILGYQIGKSKKLDEIDRS